MQLLKRFHSSRLYHVLPLPHLAKKSSRVFRAHLVSREQECCQVLDGIVHARSALNKTPWSGLNTFATALDMMVEARLLVVTE